MGIFQEMNWSLQEIAYFEIRNKQNISEQYLQQILQTNTFLTTNNLIGQLLAYNLIIIDEDREINLTLQGSEWFSARSDSYELSPKQMEICALSFMKLYINLANEWFVVLESQNLSIERNLIPHHLQQFTEHMLTLNIVSEKLGFIILNKNSVVYEEYLSSNMMSEDELLIALEKQKILGALAEKIAFEFEINRLKNADLEKESILCKLISKENVKAGYDIKSFSNSVVQHNRFIEVKAIDNNGIYLSRNEMLTAQRLEENYFLYLVNTKSKSIDIIQNPILNLDKFFARKEIMCIRYTKEQ